MKNILRTRSLKGCPMNAPFKDVEGVLDQVVQCTWVRTDTYTSVHTVLKEIVCSFCIHRMRLLVTISILLTWYYSSHIVRNNASFSHLIFSSIIIDKNTMCASSKTSWCTVCRGRTCLSRYKRYNISVDFPRPAWNEKLRILILCPLMDVRSAEGSTYSAPQQHALRYILKIVYMQFVRMFWQRYPHVQFIRFLYMVYFVINSRLLTC